MQLRRFLIPTAFIAALSCFAVVLAATSNDAARPKVCEPEGIRSGACATALAGNAQLALELDWLFGGKSQRGWGLYLPLIQSLIGSDTGADERGFAQALARWQSVQGLVPSGVLDRDTWSRMIANWQSRRIRDSVYPSSNQLVTVPVADLYDPERPMELRQVERNTYTAYKRMVETAMRDLAIAPGEKYLKIVSAFRSREYQSQLRRQSPQSGRAGLAVNSPHFSGRALDLYVGGEPVSTRDDNRALQTKTPVYRWLVKNAARFGFQPYFYEPWHWEYCN